MALRLLSVQEWKSYLNGIGIPDQYAEQYACTFYKHQVPRTLLKLLSDDELRDTYEVELGGHQLLIRLYPSQHKATDLMFNVLFNSV